jgi:hypothetical protein
MVFIDTLGGVVDVAADDADVVTGGNGADGDEVGMACELRRWCC